MKKRSVLIRLAAVLLALFCIIPPAFAEEIPEPTEYVPVSNPFSVSDLAFGSVCVLNGCRTIDSYVPLGGMERRLDTAQAAFAFERNTGTLVYAYNPDTRVSPGPLTKIMTAMITLEHCNMDDIVTVSSRNISRLPAGSKNVKLKQDEQLTVGDLLHCLIMQGANDAAIALAEHVAGNQEGFVTLMNQRAHQIGCTNTVFANVHGLDNNSQSTTARDMARIVMEATRNETFKAIFAEVSYTVPETNRSSPRSFESEDYLVDTRNVQKFYDQRVTGGMQSNSNGSGACIAYTASYHNMDMIFVIMGCTRQLFDNGWQVKVYGNLEEAQALTNYVYNTFKSNRILYDGQALKQFSVSGGEANVVAQPHLDMDSVIPADAHMDNLIFDYKDKGLKAPIRKDDMIATVEVWYRNTCLLESELYAMEDVRSLEQSGLKVLGGADRSDSESRISRIAVIISAVILVPVLGYLGINNLLRLRRRAIVRRRRAKNRRHFE